MTTRPLSIAMVCYPSFGGSGVVARELAVGLALRGHRVTLVASEPPSRPLPEQPQLAFRKVHVPSYPVFQHAPYTVAVAGASTSRRPSVTAKPAGMPSTETAWTVRPPTSKLAPSSPAASER